MSDLLVGISAVAFFACGMPTSAVAIDETQVAQSDPSQGVVDALNATLERVDDAIAAGNYEGAVGLLSGVLLFDPENARVKLILGDLYARMGSYDQARLYLKQALASNRLDQSDTEQAKILLALVDGDVPRRDRAGFVLTGRISTGIRYRTNANSGTDSDTITIQDVDVATRSDAGEESDFDWYNIASLRGTQALNDRVALDLRGVGLYRKQFDLTRNDLLVLQAKPGLFIEAYQDSGTTITARPYGIIGLAKLDNDLAYLTAGLGARFEERISRKIDLDQTFEFEKIDYRRVEDRTGLDQLDGERLRLEFGASYTFDDTLVGRVSYRFRHRNAERDFDDRDQHRLKAEVVKLYPTPFGWTDEMSAVQFGISYEDSDYDAPNPTISATREREDTEWVFEIANSIAIRDGLNADVDLTHRTRDSEFPNFERDDTSVAVGVTYKF